MNDIGVKKKGALGSRYIFTALGLFLCEADIYLCVTRLAG